MKTFWILLSAAALALSPSGNAGEVEVKKFEEKTVHLPTKGAKFIRRAFEGDLESYLALLGKFQERYEVVGVLKTEWAWHVVSRIKGSKNLLLQGGFSVAPGVYKGKGGYQKRGLSCPVGCHVAQAVDKNRATLLVNIGMEYEPLSDTVSISSGGSQLSITLKNVQKESAGGAR